MEKLEFIYRALEKANQSGAFTIKESRKIDEVYEQLVKEVQVLAQLVKQYEDEREYEDAHDEREDDKKKVKEESKSSHNGTSKTKVLNAAK